jgi:hypothetical protein
MRYVTKVIKFPYSIDGESIPLVAKNGDYGDVVVE